MGNWWSRTRRRDEDTRVSYRSRSRAQLRGLPRDVSELSHGQSPQSLPESSSGQSPQSLQSPHDSSSDQSLQLRLESLSNQLQQLEPLVYKSSGDQSPQSPQGDPGGESSTIEGLWK